MVTPKLEKASQLQMAQEEVKEVLIVKLDTFDLKKYIQQTREAFNIPEKSPQKTASEINLNKNKLLMISDEEQKVEQQAQASTQASDRTFCQFFTTTTTASKVNQVTHGSVYTWGADYNSVLGLPENSKVQVRRT